MMTKYIYLIKDKNEQIKLINLISKDYINNFYSSSYYIRNYYQNAVCNFGSMSTDLFMHLFKVLLTKNIFGYVVNIFLHGKGNRRKIFDSFIEQVLKNYKQNEENQILYGNIFVYFSSDACSRYYFFLKNMWFSGNNPMALDVINNYFLDKFKLNDKQEGIEEFLNVVNDFASSYNF